MANEDASTALYRLLMNRFVALEASHSKLRDQFRTVLIEKEEQGQRRKEEEEEEEEEWSGSDESPSDSGWANHLTGFFTSRRPYSNILQCMGHAVHICRASDGKIIYWNRAAENLYGWKHSEVIGQRPSDLLIEDNFHASLNKVIEKWTSGQSWSGQLPFRKRSDEIFMALVTKSPLYEDDVLVGVITVSSDAAIFNMINQDKIKTYRDDAYVDNREGRFNLKKIPWLPKPQISSSVSSLASKVFSRQHRDDDDDSGSYISTSRGELVENEDNEPVRATKQAAKLLEKLNVGGSDRQDNRNSPVQSSADYSAKSARGRAMNFSSFSRESSVERSDFVTDKREATSVKRNPFHTNECEYLDQERLKNQNLCKEDLWVRNKNRFAKSWLECQECCQLPIHGNSFHQLPSEHDGKEESLPNLENSNEAFEDKTKVPKRLEVTQSSALMSSEDSSGSSHENLTTNGNNFDCEVHWDDLDLAEEIGQGAFAAVYRGIWNGSDVAVKLYTESEYQEATLLDYKKEVAIMQRLRHPNVLLFMGAVYSPERLAIVTEFLPRGSLFKVLHKSNQALDMKRRLRMALDVVRGMNYLHHRNPPILHRDLKSSNLLVDKNWNVKVGDFGLSKWKHSTFVTARSGRGTPQWMAPEVLRNEPSNEKSDVFSFGVILWELVTASIPWRQLNSLQVVGVVGFMDRRLDIPDTLDPQLSSIIHDCWHSEPDRRPSFKDLIPRMTDLIRTLTTTATQKSLKS